MPKILDRLREDHRNLSRLLGVITREINRFEEGETPDYELVDTILDYCLNYPDTCHHPKEDLIFKRLAKRAPVTAQVIGNLTDEHDQLGRLTRRFSAALRNVISDETLPREWFTNIAKDYLSFQRNHMQMEEVLFFPAAADHLTPKDWDDLDRKVDEMDDPLFGDEVHDHYRDVFDAIIEWDSSAGGAAPAAEGAGGKT